MKKTFLTINSLVLLICILSCSLVSCSDSNIPKGTNYVSWYSSGNSRSGEGYLINAEKVSKTYYALHYANIRAYGVLGIYVAIVHESNVTFHKGYVLEDFDESVLSKILEIRPLSSNDICDILDVEFENGFVRCGTEKYNRSSDIVFEKDIYADGDLLWYPAYQ